jgi:hypothetical protein
MQGGGERVRCRKRLRDRRIMILTRGHRPAQRKGSLLGSLSHGEQLSTGGDCPAWLVTLDTETVGAVVPDRGVVRGGGAR